MLQTDIAIMGAAGMGAGELLRYLSAHPSSAEVQLVSRSQAGRTVSSVHPHLHRFGNLKFINELLLPQEGSEQPFVIFSAMAHGELAALYPDLKKQLEQTALLRPLLLIDLSADFRLDKPLSWMQYYGSKHSCPQYLSDFIYGLPEHNRSLLSTATRIASPGCFATAINLCLLPLAHLLDGRYIAISAVTGSSGSGIMPTEGTHHPHRAHDYRAYNMLQHRHQAELEMLLAAKGSAGARISFIPHSAPMVRGIFATVQIECESENEAMALAALYDGFYSSEPFVDVLPTSPRVATVAGSNRAELHAMCQGRTLAVMAAIDNLGKGMAGQAIQCMNIALGLPETTGLLQPAVYP